MEWYSVEQVADLLGLHVKTVRNYVREGRLNAVRIGKQYRISREDVERLTGAPVPASVRESTARHRHAEVSSIVQVDAIGPVELGRLTAMLSGIAAGHSQEPQPLRIETVYDERRASLKVILLGSLASCAQILKLIDTVLEDGR